MKPITPEELNALKPSYDNPVELVCFDDYYPSCLRQISAVTPFVKKIYTAIDSSGDLIVLDASYLKHYTLKKQINEVELYFTVDAYSNLELCDSEGCWYNFRKEVKYASEPDIDKRRKQNRQQKPVAVLNLDSYELRWL